MIFLKLSILFLAFGFSSLTYAQNNPQRIEATSIGWIWSSQTDLPIGYNLCDGNRWQIHDTFISTIERGSICLVNGLYQCHEFILTNDGFVCELGGLRGPILPNGLPVNGNVFVSHRGDRYNFDESNLTSIIIEGLEHGETRSFNVGACNFSINKTGNQFTISSDDLAFETKFNPKIDSNYAVRSFADGIDITAREVAGIPFNHDCFEGI